MIDEYDTCALCEEYLSDPYQTAEFAVKAGIATAHKHCLMQLMRGVWDEQMARVTVKIPIDAPYTDRYIADPKVRKARGLEPLDSDRPSTHDLVNDDEFMETMLTTATENQLNSVADLIAGRVAKKHI